MISHAVSISEGGAAAMIPLALCVVVTSQIFNCMVEYVQPCHVSVSRMGPKMLQIDQHLICNVHGLFWRGIRKWE